MLPICVQGTLDVSLSVESGRRSMGAKVTVQLSFAFSILYMVLCRLDSKGLVKSVTQRRLVL